MTLETWLGNRRVVLAAALYTALTVLAGPVDAAEPSLRPVAITAGSGQLGARLVPVPAVVTDASDRGGQVRVDNVAGLAETFRITVSDYTLDAQSRAVAAPPGYPYGSAAWYRFEATAFELPPGSSRDVHFTLDVPPDAVPGDHIAALTVVVRAAHPPQVAGTQIQSELVFQIRLQHRVPGAEPRAPRVRLEANPMAGAVDFIARVTNDGNTVLMDQLPPLATLQLYSTLPLSDPRRAERSFTLDGFYVPPESERLVRLTWHDPPLIGAYRAVVTLPAADGMPAVTAATDFVVVDWIRIAVILAVLGLVCLAALVVVRRRGQSRAPRRPNRRSGSRGR